jgi:ribosomal protein S18 acetylase RimI-like enzyme
MRGATPDDVARIRAIAQAAYAKYVERIGREPAPMLADYAGDVAGQRVVVIEAGASVQGYLVAWPEADAYFIANIGVDPRCQGAGLGRRLMDHAIAEARRLQLPALKLYTHALMAENLCMYAHLGFVETHRVFENGFDRVYMRLSLA